MQAGRCGICTGRRPVPVDSHCHGIRGWMCCQGCTQHPAPHVCVRKRGCKCAAVAGAGAGLGASALHAQQAQRRQALTRPSRIKSSTAARQGSADLVAVYWASWPACLHLLQARSLLPHAGMRSGPYATPPASSPVAGRRAGRSTPSVRGRLGAGQHGQLQRGHHKGPRQRPGGGAIKDHNPQLLRPPGRCPSRRPGRWWRTAWPGPARGGRREQAAGEWARARARRWPGRGGSGFARAPQPSAPARTRPPAGPTALPPPRRARLSRPGGPAGA